MGVVVDQALFLRPVDELGEGDFSSGIEAHAESCFDCLQAAGGGVGSAASGWASSSIVAAPATMRTYSDQLEAKGADTIAEVRAESVDHRGHKTQRDPGGAPQRRRPAGPGRAGMVTRPKATVVRQ